MRGSFFLFTLLFSLVFSETTFAENWMQFRGAKSHGVSSESSLPTTWKASNTLWETDLPGKGSSSPIVIGDKVIVTCYSGYGDGKNDGDANKLRRHLICVNKNNGKIEWDKEITSEHSEDKYSGYLTEHGYASSTPVSDGKTIFAFFGKTGAMAFDLSGKKLWEKNLGTESSNRRWGSAASPILYKNMVIFNASDESQGLYALDKKTGKEIWKTQAAGLELCYSTPVIVKTKQGTTEIVLPVAGEVWGLNPENGKLRWYCETSLTGNISPTAQVDGDIVYVFGGYRGSGSIAIRAGGKGDIGESHVLWESKETSYVASPLLHDGHLYWVDDRGQAHCTSAKDGNSVYRERLVSGSGGRPVYASPVKVGNALYIPSRWKGVYVLSATPEFKEIAVNQFPKDETDFNGTPAVSENKMYIRSDQALYCIGTK